MNYKITKIAENNVEVIPHKKIKDINGVEFTILDDDTESYGQERITNEMAEAQKQLEDAQKFDAVAYKKDLIQKAKDRIVLLQTIQKEMKK